MQVYAEATVAFPLIVAASFAKVNKPMEKSMDNPMDKAA